MKRLGILTGGGDAPGLNAVIRAVVKTAILEYGYEVLGVQDGFDGFLEEGGIFPLTLDSVRGILPRGGTILGAANRGNPFSRRVVRNGEEVYEDISHLVIEAIRATNLEALIVVGGDGTLKIAKEFFDQGLPIIGVPKTIDNDIGGTDVSFGFDTASSTAMEAIDRLHTTAEAHHRAMVVELMGRDAGFIALRAGVAGGADVILIPEIPFHFDAICAKINQRVQHGSYFSILAVAEGSQPVGGEQVFWESGNEVYAARLGGIGQAVAKFISASCQIESRVTILGHLQRGGSPTSFDRWLATRYGAAAVRLAAQKGLGRMVALRNDQIVDVSLSDAVSKPKRVDLNGDAVTTARGLGISFGD